MLANMDALCVCMPGARMQGDVQPFSRSGTHGRSSVAPTLESSESEGGGLGGRGTGVGGGAGAVKRTVVTLKRAKLEGATAFKSCASLSRLAVAAGVVGAGTEIFAITEPGERLSTRTAEGPPGRARTSATER